MSKIIKVDKITNPNMKILFILDVYAPHVGGVEILFENIISQLRKKGFEIVILTSKFSKDINSYERISEGVEIYRVGHNRYDFMLFSIFTGIKLAKTCDIIHTTTYNSAIPASIIGKISGKKVILTVHEIFREKWYTFMGWRGFFYKTFESFIFKFSYDKYICVSDNTSKDIKNAYNLEESKVITIHNGMDYELWNREKYPDFQKLRDEYRLNDNFLGLYFGRPGISKGLEYYIKSIPTIVKNIPNFHALLIVPESDKKRVLYIKELIDELDISSHITWIPGVPYKELGNYILTADFAIVPSLAEGFGFAAVEVCSLGQKLVSSRCGSLPEVVSGKVSFCYPQEEGSITQAIVGLYNGEYEQIHPKKFSWDKNIEKTIDVYNEEVGRKV